MNDATIGLGFDGLTSGPGLGWQRCGWCRLEVLPPSHPHSSRLLVEGTNACAGMGGLAPVRDAGYLTVVHGEHNQASGRLFHPFLPPRKDDASVIHIVCVTEARNVIAVTRCSSTIQCNSFIKEGDI
jgi:hypothetical protein